MSISVKVKSTRVHGIEMFKVLVNGTEAGQAYSIAGAKTIALRLAAKLGVSLTWAVKGATP